jgi:hypothetical protein
MAYRPVGYAKVRIAGRPVERKPDENRERKRSGDYGALHHASLKTIKI